MSYDSVTLHADTTLWSVPDTRIVAVEAPGGCKLRRAVGSEVLGPLPQDLAELSRWEAELAKEIISKYLYPAEVTERQSDRGDTRKGVTSARRKGVTAQANFGGVEGELAAKRFTAVRSLLVATSVQAIDALRKEWLEGDLGASIDTQVTNSVDCSLVTLSSYIATISDTRPPAHCISSRAGTCSTPFWIAHYCGSVVGDWGSFR